MRHALHHLRECLNEVRASLGAIIATDIPYQDIGVRHAVSLTNDPSDLLRSGKSLHVEAISDNDTIPMGKA
jgi:hypothetical protein